MFTTQGFSNGTFFGVPDLETRYVAILVVLATTAMICVRLPHMRFISYHSSRTLNPEQYAVFTTSHHYLLIPPWSSPSRARRPQHEPLSAKNFPKDLLVSTVPRVLCTRQVLTRSGDVRSRRGSRSRAGGPSRQSLVPSRCCRSDRGSLVIPRRGGN